MPQAVIHFHGVLQRVHDQRAITEILYDLEWDGLQSTGLRARREGQSGFAAAAAFNIEPAMIEPALEVYYDTAVSSIPPDHAPLDFGASYVDYPSSVPVAITSAGLPSRLLR